MGVTAYEGVIAYDPETGVFSRIGGGRKRVGGWTKAGYLLINVKGKRIYAHRLAWLMTHGIWPPEEIDHINGDHRDNRIVNLRLASHAENCRNRKYRKAKPGLLGVQFHPQSGKWRPTIMVNGKNIYSGLYDTPEDAARARDQLAVEHHGQFAKFNFGPSNG